MFACDCRRWELIILAASHWTQLGSVPVKTGRKAVCGLELAGVLKRPERTFLAPWSDPAGMRVTRSSVRNSLQIWRLRTDTQLPMLPTPFRICICALSSHQGTCPGMFWELSTRIPDSCSMDTLFEWEELMERFFRHPHGTHPWWRRLPRILRQVGTYLGHPHPFPRSEVETLPRGQLYWICAMAAVGCFCSWARVAETLREGLCPVCTSSMLPIVPKCVFSGSHMVRSHLSWSLTCPLAHLQVWWPGS